jgi:ParB-like chromosome segregation protein Spo0J
MTQGVSSGISLRSLGELHESEANPRTISATRLALLKSDLEHDRDMLWARPIIATPDGEVVAGNMRLRAAAELGWTEIPVFTEALSDERKREWMLRDNASYGDWIPGQLADTIAEAQHQGSDLTHLGFNEAEVNGFLRRAATEAKGAQEQLPSVFAVVIDCADEHQQASLLERFAAEGLTARALLA